MYKCICAYLYVRMHTYVCMYLYTYIHTYIYIHTSYTIFCYVYLFACMYVPCGLFPSLMSSCSSSTTSAQHFLLSHNEHHPQIFAECTWKSTLPVVRNNPLMSFGSFFGLACAFLRFARCLQRHLANIHASTSIQIPQALYEHLKYFDAANVCSSRSQT